jgi:hypothetical protein
MKADGDLVRPESWTHGRGIPWPHSVAARVPIDALVTQPTDYPSSIGNAL